MATIWSLILLIGVFPMPTRTAQDDIVTIVNEKFSVEARGYKWYQFDVGDSGAYLEGSFTAEGGPENDIFFCIVDEEGFNKFKENRPAAKVFYSTGRRENPNGSNGFVHKASIRVRLNSGSYYLWFSNIASIYDKQVTAEIRMRPE